MPISIDEFESESSDLGKRTNAQRILDFLSTHDDEAFTRSEIAGRTDVGPNSVGPVLSRLKEQGLVRHRGRYWALAEQARDDEQTGSQSVRLTEGSAADDESSTRHRNAATAFAERVTDQLEDDIDAIYLFGSVARQDDSAASDVDVLAVIADGASYGTTDDRLLDIAFEIQLEYDIPIEVHTMTASEFSARTERGEPFVRTVLRDGDRYV
jgi:predicted nucleotidyltransferase